VALNRSDSIGEPLDIRAEMAFVRAVWARARQVKSVPWAVQSSHRHGPPRRCCSLRDLGKDEGVAVLVVGIDTGNAEAPLWMVSIIGQVPISAEKLP